MYEFLCAETHVGIHPTTVSDNCQSLDFEVNVDGVVVKLLRMEGLRAGIHYLLLPRLKYFSLYYVYIKKHWDLSKCSDADLNALRNGGYTLVLTVLLATV